MKTFLSLKDIPSNFFKFPVALTIGFFDGVHKGHLSLISYLKKTPGHHCILTFSSHPQKVLFNKTIPLITSFEHKVLLLKEQKIHVIAIPFSLKISSLSPEEFLTKIKKFIPFSFLVIGHDSTIGKNREGSSSFLSQLGKKMLFSVEQIQPMKDNSEAISSSLIRSLIRKGDLNSVEKKLGRPYSIAQYVTKGSGKGKILGCPTANLKVSSLCLPPLGVYLAKIKHNNDIYEGILNLGYAPTVSNLDSPILEVFLFTPKNLNLYEEFIEVFFLSFIREERKFSSINALKKQILNDILDAKNYFSKFYKANTSIY